MEARKITGSELMILKYETHPRLRGQVLRGLTRTQWKEAWQYLTGEEKKEFLTNLNESGYDKDLLEYYQKHLPLD